MTTPIKRKIFLVILILIVSMLSANISAASMKHMDDSQCMMQATCNNCFIPSVTNSSDLKFFYLNISPIYNNLISFESCVLVPPFPPPKT